jgi:hypothetical protein
VPFIARKFFVWNKKSLLVVCHEPEAPKKAIRGDVMLSS